LLRHLGATDPEAIRERLDLPDRYVVSTLHRPSNVDDPARLSGLVKALHSVADQCPLLLPVHPRGRSSLTDAGLFEHPAVSAMDPLGYLDFLRLVRGCEFVITDSGGIQEETTVLGIPCLTVRANTERPVTVTFGSNRLVEVTELAVLAATYLARRHAASWPVPPLWDGKSGERIAEVLERCLAGP
jgi:UDP-N-acetylglucosamine 2-epimerase (non-hydrolysing)